MNFPTLVAPWTSGKVTVPFGPVRCPECKVTGVPEPVLTCLGDFVLRMGGWCRKCRVMCCLLDVTFETAALVPPAKFLLYDQRLPQSVVFPSVRRSFFDMNEFSFGLESTDVEAAR